MDYHMPGISGAEAVSKIREVKPTQQILAFSLDDTREVMRENFKAGAVDFLDKNSENEVLLSTIATYCAKYEQLYRPIDGEQLASDEKRKLIYETGMIGCSDQTYELCRQIRKIAPTQATALILGESGTGKELVAQALHKFSERAKCPFVAINIAAESAGLLDSTLFGHRKGAFTGAIEDQMGKFRLANKGTLFLDEIGDMNLDLQVKLLRVLQEREVNPLGHSRAIPIDVRIIAATHKDLRKMVLNGTFREDLYYRLSSVFISTTPLRERTEDIEPLVAHFTAEICKENGFSRFFHRRCLEVLRKYPWKGNVRELRSVVERHLVRSDADSVRPEDLEASLYEVHPSSVPVTMKEIDSHVENLKKGLVAEVLKVGSPAEAARRLGISQNHLSYFMDKWGLRRAQR
ncbi:MAG: sigma-54 dependent transcriptional regulator, partial [Patescibacteria group bacterium]